MKLVLGHHLLHYKYCMTHQKEEEEEEEGFYTRDRHQRKKVRKHSKPVIPDWKTERPCGLFSRTSLVSGVQVVDNEDAGWYEKSSQTENAFKSISTFDSLERIPNLYPIHFTHHPLHYAWMARGYSTSKSSSSGCMGKGAEEMKGRKMWMAFIQVASSEIYI